MLKEFKEFALRGNVVDMAVGIIVGAAFGTIVNSLVSDIITPPIGLLLGKVDFSNFFLILKKGINPGPYPSLSSAQSAGAVTLNYGLFITKVINFLIVSFAVFLLVRSINRLKREREKTTPKTKECPYCFLSIPINAIRCPHCTSELK